MAEIQTLPVEDLRVLLPDRRRHLRAIDRTPATITSYLTVGEQFVALLVAHGMPPPRRRSRASTSRRSG